MDRFKEHIASLPPLSVFILRKGLSVAAFLAFLALLVMIKALADIRYDYILAKYALYMIDMAALSTALVISGALLIDLYARSQKK